jgi:surfeit locus 1 family protein
MYRFLLSRRWLAGLLITAVVVGACLDLGFWQLRRLDARKKTNAIARTNLRTPATSVAAVLTGGDVNKVLYRHVTARGRYDVAQEVLLTGRAVNDRPGSDVLTPLVTSDGRALIVNRGFVPLDISAPGDQRARPPSGTVTVSGILLPTEQRGAFGASIPPTGRVTLIPRVDVARIGRQLPYAVFPAYLLMDSQQPAQQENVPQAERFVPDLSNGPHFNYAVQWFLFAALAVAGYTVLAWRKARAVEESIDADTT